MCTCLWECDPEERNFIKEWGKGETTALKERRDEPSDTSRGAGLVQEHI